MAYEALSVTTVDPGTLIKDAQGFMSYGPIGLAGLLFVMVLTAVLLRNVDEARERILKLVLFLGSFCFIAALLAQHFTPPEKEPPSYSKQRAVLSNVIKSFDAAAPKLQQINDMASSEGCPGGSHGITIPHGADMAARSSAVEATLEAAKANISAVIDSLRDGK